MPFQVEGPSTFVVAEGVRCLLGSCANSGLRLERERTVLVREPRCGHLDVQVMVVLRANIGLGFQFNPSWDFNTSGHRRGGINLASGYAGGAVSVDLRRGATRVALVLLKPRGPISSLPKAPPQLISIAGYTRCIVNADPAAKRSLKQSLPDPIDSKRTVQLEKLARESVIAQHLSHLASRAELAEAWVQYETTLREIKASDLEMLGPIELAFEEGDDADLEQLPARVHAITRWLRSDLQDTWARLRARSLIEALKQVGSLRKLASEIHVSAPYLSQLSNGSGPVPSERILARLEAGLRSTGPESPTTPMPPGDTLKPVEERIEEITKRLFLLARRRAKPAVSVEFPDTRIRKHLEDCLGALANRFVDPEEGKLVEELLASLVSADGPELSQWSQLARNDSLRELVSLITLLNDEQRDAMLALVKSIPAPDPTPQVAVVKKAQRPH